MARTFESSLFSCRRACRFFFAALNALLTENDELDDDGLSDKLGRVEKSSTVSFVLSAAAVAFRSICFKSSPVDESFPPTSDIFQDSVVVSFECVDSRAIGCPGELVDTELPYDCFTDGGYDC